MKRILVIGVSCSGKTTLGSRLGNKLGIPVFDLDEYFWLPNWKILSEQQFRDKVDELTLASSWIVSGNYYSVASHAWERATDLIWLDYPLRVVLWRGLLRCIKRSVLKQQVCNGNYESFRRHFFTKDSMILWILKTFWRRKREFPKRILQYNLNTKIFKSPKECTRWLEKELYHEPINNCFNSDLC